ncbi:uncharacterized protein [Watersipora subatra]|uniref:uncharacterized protein n=1 Tax=Watersipora subatra TaxID=2589382 RepID=UPI00355BC1C7
MLGEQAEDVVLSRGIEETDYDSVIDAFNEYFGVRRNLIVERAKFNKLTQGSDSIDVFIHNLYRQAEFCDYRALREELIRDRLVVGITEDKLSEKLQADADLTLDDTVMIARRFESAKHAQSVVRGSAVDVHANRFSSRQPQHSRKNDASSSNQNSYLKGHKSSNTGNIRHRPTTQGHANSFDNTFANNRVASSIPKDRCKRCGKAPHSRDSCPALRSTCTACGKRGHWKQMCFSGKSVTEVELFTGEIKNSHRNGSKPWMAKLAIDIQGHTNTATFKLDSGAAATVSGPNAISAPLQPNTKRLRGPGNLEIPCIDQTDAILTHGNKSISETIYVVRNQDVNLLSKFACQSLGLLACNVDNVDDFANGVDNFVDKRLFQGLGAVKTECEIRLTDDAKPYSIFVLRAVPFPLLDKTKLERMKSLGFIVEAKQPTEWCAPMVVVPKQDSVRICTDFTQLNKYVRRENFPMATVEDSLSKLNGGHIFSKLDANCGFWQIPLFAKSQHLTTFLTPFGRFYYCKNCHLDKNQLQRYSAEK